MRYAALLATLLLAACGADPAPDDIDGLARWFWLNHAAATDAQVLDSAVKLEAAVAGQDLPLKSTVSLLQPGDVDASLVEPAFANRQHHRRQPSAQTVALFDAPSQMVWQCRQPLQCSP